MGSGLACSQHGKHIAYTAGTGILVFLDLVAYLLIRIVDKYGHLGIGGSGSEVDIMKNQKRTSGPAGAVGPRGGSNGVLIQSERSVYSRTMG